MTQQLNSAETSAQEQPLLPIDPRLTPATLRSDLSDPIGQNSAAVRMAMGNIAEGGKESLQAGSPRVEWGPIHDNNQLIEVIKKSADFVRANPAKPLPSPTIRGVSIWGGNIFDILSTHQSIGAAVVRRVTDSGHPEYFALDLHNRALGTINDQGTERNIGIPTTGNPFFARPLNINWLPANNEPLTLRNHLNDLIQQIDSNAIIGTGNTANVHLRQKILNHPLIVAYFDLLRALAANISVNNEPNQVQRGEAAAAVRHRLGAQLDNPEQIREELPQIVKTWVEERVNFSNMDSVTRRALWSTIHTSFSSYQNSSRPITEYQNFLNRALDWNSALTADQVDRQNTNLKTFEVELKAIHTGISAGSKKISSLTREQRANQTVSTRLGIPETSWTSTSPDPNISGAAGSTGEFLLLKNKYDTITAGTEITAINTAITDLESKKVSLITLPTGHNIASATQYNAELDNKISVLQSELRQKTTAQGQVLQDLENQWQQLLTKKLQAEQKIIDTQEEIDNEAADRQTLLERLVTMQIRLSGIRDFAVSNEITPAADWDPSRILGQFLALSSTTTTPPPPRIELTTWQGFSFNETDIANQIQEVSQVFTEKKTALDNEPKREKHNPLQAFIRIYGQQLVETGMHTQSQAQQAAAAHIISLQEDESTQDSLKYLTGRYQKIQDKGFFGRYLTGISNRVRTYLQGELSFANAFEKTCTLHPWLMKAFKDKSLLGKIPLLGSLTKPLRERNFRGDLRHDFTSGLGLFGTHGLRINEADICEAIKSHSGKPEEQLGELIEVRAIFTHLIDRAEGRAILKNASDAQISNFHLFFHGLNTAIKRVRMSMLSENLAQEGETSSGVIAKYLETGAETQKALTKSSEDYIKSETGRQRLNLTYNLSNVESYKLYLQAMKAFNKAVAAGRYEARDVNKFLADMGLPFDYKVWRRKALGQHKARLGFNAVGRMGKWIGKNILLRGGKFTGKAALITAFWPIFGIAKYAEWRNRQKEVPVDNGETTDDGNNEETEIAENASLVDQVNAAVGGKGLDRTKPTDQPSIAEPDDDDDTPEAIFGRRKRGRQ